MTNPLADISNICFVDTETRAEPHVSASDGNVKEAGTYRYAKRSFVIISTWGIADRPVFDVSLNRGFDGDWLQFSELPYELQEFYKRAEQGEAWFAAWNAGFDKAALSLGTYDFPRIRPDMIIDVMAQATASNLPPSLEGASRAIGSSGKHPDGKPLIKMFCTPQGQTPFTKPAEWETFKLYGRQDVHEMREVWRATRALDFSEWEDYWVSERINERGIAIDLPMVERAAAIAAADRARINEQLKRWTNGKITAVTQTVRIASWIYDRVGSEARSIMSTQFNENAAPSPGEEVNDLIVVESEEPGDDEAVTKVVRDGVKVSINRDNIDKLVAFFNAKSEAEGGLSERDQLIVDVLTARQFGGSSSPAKFQKMLDQHDDGVLKGMYVFNGAPQTGRFSSKGVQTHNLVRSSLEEFEVPAIEMINELELK